MTGRLGAVAALSPRRAVPGGADRVVAGVSVNAQKTLQFPAGRLLARLVPPDRRRSRLAERAL